eukprot:scaffold50909_cov39-Phaeocystis_antarctica.AAC.1
MHDTYGPMCQCANAPCGWKGGRGAGRRLHDGLSLRRGPARLLELLIADAVRPSRGGPPPHRLEGAGRCRRAGRGGGRGGDRRSLGVELGRGRGGSCLLQRGRLAHQKLLRLAAVAPHRESHVSLRAADDVEGLLVRGDGRAVDRSDDVHRLEAARSGREAARLDELDAGVGNVAGEHAEPQPQLGRRRLLVQHDDLILP